MTKYDLDHVATEQKYFDAGLDKFLRRAPTAVLLGIAGAVMLCLLSGCVTGKGLVKALDKMKDNHSTITAEIVGPGYTVKLTRTNPNTNTPPLTAGGSSVTVKGATP